MKNLNNILLLLVLATMFGCEPPITFNEPQPSNTKNLSEFPKRLQGEYLGISDRSTLIINDYIIQEVYDYNETIHINQLDTNSRLSGDTLIDLSTNERTIITRVGDSIINHIHGIDTLFQINADNVLRKFKGYYFINTRCEKESWKVEKIQLSKGELSISSISTKLELENLKEITETPQDTIPPYNFKATKKQFKEFVKNNGFRDTKTFIRK